MGRKKVDVGGTTRAAQESLDLRPFCYYCDKEFATVKELIQHQRTKHFNCAECGLKFDTITGLRVHMLNAYKKTMKEVPGAIQGRENPDIVVHGMEGLPKSIVEERTQKALAEQADRNREKAERAAARAAERGAEPPPPPPGPSGRGDGEAAPEPPLPPRPDTVAPPVRVQWQDRASAIAPPGGSHPAMVGGPGAGAGGMMASPVPAQGSTAQAAPGQPAQQQRPAGAAGALGGAMPKLSPAVAKLLSGSAHKGKGETVVVPGRPDLPVPSALVRLHPIALQVLAAAGALPGSTPMVTAPAFHGPAAGMMSAPLGMVPGGFGQDAKRLRVA
eukprot:TRINITY_DN11784_c0_g4_i4.p1 TRINITY_DN11784_c0_g4~~TRINITY_DN11784_c0_g4_i4.p1  ORF type:complete len:349 (+),score=70.29 TRINITY_DN11784_c0_g4_i4:55-1047(+)